MATAPASGSSSREPFAYFDPDSSSWKMCQASLLEDSGESCTTWPRQVTWDLSYVYELPTSALHIFEIGSSSLLPTPQTADGTGAGSIGERRRTTGSGRAARRRRRRSRRSRRSFRRRARARARRRRSTSRRSATTWRIRTSACTCRAGSGTRRGRSRGSYRRSCRHRERTTRPAARDRRGRRGRSRGRRVAEPAGHRPPPADAERDRRDEGKSGPNADARNRLANLEQLLPTPTTQDAANTAGPSQLERDWSR